MSIFDFISRNSSSLNRKKWSIVSTAMLQTFKDIRKELYGTSVEILQHVFYEDQPLYGHIYDDQKQGIKIKAFQLYLSSYIIAKYRWVKQSMGRNFADLLWAQVLGNLLIEGVEEAKGFSSKVDSFPRIYKFFCLLSKDITGKLNLSEGFLLMDKLGSTFVGECVYAVSAAFEQSNIEKIVDCEIVYAQQVIKEISEIFYRETENIKKDNGPTRSLSI